MEDFKFWKKWNKTFRRLFFLLTVIFSASTAFLVTGAILGFDAVVTWTLIPEFDTVNVPVDNFIQNLISYSVEVNSYLVKQRFQASELIVNPLSSYIFLGFIVIGFIFFLSVITYLDIFWFGLAMSAFLVFLVTLKTELLSVFGQENRTFLIGLVFIFLIVAYYFQTINKNISFLFRLTTFSALVLTAAFILDLASTEPLPFLHIANFGLPIPIILSAIFLFIIAYDLVYFFLYLVSAGKSSNPKSRLINFVIITGLYLSNLLLVYLKKQQTIDWDILYISPFIIFLLSAVIGLWAYRDKLKNSSTLSFYPNGAFLYISLAIISVSTMAFAFVTGNDPLIDMFEYMILYFHIGFGFIFFLYVLINFADLFPKNVNVFKVTFQPRRMPYIIMQGVAFMFALSLFLYNNRYAYYLGASGYYNQGGDVYYYKNNYLLANEYYKEGFAYAYQNHRSNYSLGSIALREGKKSTAQQFFTQSLVKHPTPYAYIKLSNLYLDENMFFPSLFMLRDAAKTFEENTPILNNLGLAYAKTNSLDSAYIFFEKAIESRDQNPVAAANLMAFLVNKGLVQEADSLAPAGKFSEDIAFQNNHIVVKSLLGQPVERPFLEQSVSDSILEGAEFPYVYNYALKTVQAQESDLPAKVSALAEKPENSNFKDHLRLIAELQKWYTGDKFEALKSIEILKNTTSYTAPYFAKILGMLLFKQQAYDKAAFYLKEAHQDQDQEAMLYYALSLVESGKGNEAIPIIKKLQISEFEDIKLIADNLLMILKTRNFQELSNWDDALRFQYLHFNRNRLTEKEILEIASSIRSEPVKVLASAELMDYYLTQGDVKKAEQIIQEVQLPAENSYYKGEVNLQYLKLLTAQEDWNKLLTLLPEIYVNEEGKTLLPYFYGRAYQGTGKIEQAESSYLKAVESNPFYEKVFVYAGNLFYLKGEKDQAYEIMVDGLELHPNSVPLLKSYIRLAMQLNLKSFAADAMENLGNLISGKELTEFKKEVNF